LNLFLLTHRITATIKARTAIQAKIIPAIAQLERELSGTGVED